MNEAPRDDRLRVLGIPAPSSSPYTLQHRAWFWLYRTTRRIEHRLGRHQKPLGYSISPRCDWCGHRSAAQREIARKNRELATERQKVMSEERLYTLTEARRIICGQWGHEIEVTDIRIAPGILARQMVQCSRCGQAWQPSEDT